MPPPVPSPRMATHLIRVTQIDDFATDGEHGIAPSYESPAALATRRSYIGLVRQLGESADEAGVIYSDGTARVVILSASDPGLKSQALVEWGWLPAGLSPPPTGTSPVTPPPGWVPEKVGMVTADGTSWASPGSWRATAIAKT